MFYLDECEKPQCTCDNCQKPFEDVAKALGVADAFGIEVLNSWGPVTPTDVYDKWEVADQMGFIVGSNLMALQMTMSDEPVRYLTLVHLPTGQRIRITLPYEEREVLDA